MGTLAALFQAHSGFKPTAPVGTLAALVCLWLQHHLFVVEKSACLRHLTCQRSHIWKASLINYVRRMVAKPGKLLERTLLPVRCPPLSSNQSSSSERRHSHHTCAAAHLIPLSVWNPIKPLTGQSPIGQPASLGANRSRGMSERPGCACVMLMKLPKTLKCAAPLPNGSIWCSQGAHVAH